MQGGAREGGLKLTTFLPVFMPKQFFSPRIKAGFSKTFTFSVQTSSPHPVLHPSIDSSVLLKAFESSRLATFVKSYCCHHTPLNQNTSNRRAYCFSLYRHTSTDFPAPTLNKHMCSCSALISRRSVFYTYIYIQLLFLVQPTPENL